MEELIQQLNAIHSVHQGFGSIVLNWLASNVVGILTGILTLLLMLYIYKIQQKDNAIQEARNILLSPNSFGNEKKRALETLAKHKRSLAGVKICGTPERLVNLNGLDLSIFSIHHTIDLYNIFFLCCDLQWAQFDGRDLSHTEFNNSMLADVYFYHTNLTCVHFFGSDLSCATFDNVNLTLTSFYDFIAPNDYTKYAKCLHDATFKLCWVFGRTQKEAEGYKPRFPPHFEVIATDRPHKNEEGEVDGYYIEVKLRENKTS